MGILLLTRQSGASSGLRQMEAVHQIPRQGVSPLSPPPHSLACGYQDSTLSNAKCTKVTWASQTDADSDSAGQGMTAIPCVYSAASLAEAATQEPCVRSEDLEGMLLGLDVFPVESIVHRLYFPSPAHRFLSTSQMGASLREANEAPPGQCGGPP